MNDGRKMIKEIAVIGLISTITINSVSAVNITQLYNDIQACPYNISEYRYNAFDCSNMAAMLMEWLNDGGYHCDYVSGQLKELHRWHAWLYCNGVFVESTWKDIAWWYYNNQYTVQHMKYIKPQTILLWRILYPREYAFPERW